MKILLSMSLIVSGEQDTNKVIVLHTAMCLQVELEDMDWNEELQAFTFQCPCGDLFQITLEELAAGMIFVSLI